MNPKIIGIMGAMPEEIDGIANLLSNMQEVKLGGRVYYTGFLNGIRTIVVFSRWGKVASATTVTTLILKFGITELLFTGVAGAIHPELHIGDIVIGKRLFQHDMDARPLIQQFELPLLGVTFLECRKEEITAAQNAIRDLLNKKQLNEAISKEALEHFGINEPRLFAGDIASGDKFFSNNEDKQTLSNLLPSVLCVEMEGAAVAQVCFEYKIPFTVIRTISDTADEKAELDFPLFIKTISSKYAVAIAKAYYRQF